MWPSFPKEEPCLAFSSRISPPPRILSVLRAAIWIKTWWKALCLAIPTFEISQYHFDIASSIVDTWHSHSSAVCLLLGTPRFFVFSLFLKHCLLLHQPSVTSSIFPLVSHGTRHQGGPVWIQFSIRESLATIYSFRLLICSPICQTVSS